MSRKTRKDDSIDVGDEGLPWWRRPGRGAILSLLTLAVMLVVAAAGLERLKTRVESLPEYNPTAKLQLMDTPLWVERERWRPQILASIHLPEKPNWVDGRLVQDVARQLTDAGWAAQVKRIQQEMDGTIRIWCDYRRPIAMVRTSEEDNEYVAIDKEGVRLPRVYKDIDEAGYWLQIVGVESAVPPPGQAFQTEDAKAAIKIAEVINQQAIAKDIRIIDVSNFHRRKNKRQDQIFLRVRGRSDPITWGSAIGEEFEEPGWQRKITLIALTLKRGSASGQANVSYYADRVITKLQPAIQTADGSQTRDR